MKNKNFFFTLLKLVVVIAAFLPDVAYTQSEEFQSEPQSISEDNDDRLRRQQEEENSNQQHFYSSPSAGGSRSSEDDGANPPDPGGDPGAPIDGGLSLLLAAGAGYGIKRAKLNKKSKK